MAQSWLCVGFPDNWQTAFQYGNIWGLKDTTVQRTLWKRLCEGDRVFFYATSPVSGVIGFGTITTRFTQDGPLWPQEIRENRLIWPLRFEFQVEYCLPSDRWKLQRYHSDTLLKLARRGFQALAEDVATEIAKSFPTVKISVIAEDKAPYEGEALEEAPPSHTAMLAKMLEIGKLQGFIAEKEYDMDGGRLDAVWRRVEKAVPTYVFEVHIGGDIYHALAKLKHAYDIWNSRIYLVAGLEHQGKTHELLGGTFHEIRSQLVFIQIEKVEQLLALKRSVRALEKELGLF